MTCQGWGGGVGTKGARVREGDLRLTFSVSHCHWVLCPEGTSHNDGKSDLLTLSSCQD